MSIRIEKNSKGTYDVRVWSRNKDIFGKRATKQKSNIRTVALAQRLAAIMEDEVSEDKPDYDKMTFRELNDLYMQKRAPFLSPSTIDTLSRVIKSTVAYLGNVKIKDINTKVIQNYMDKLASTENQHKPGVKLKKGTLQRYYRHIQAVLNWGVGQDYLELNRVRRVEMESDDNPFSPTIIDAKTITELLTFFKQSFYILYIPILLSITTGSRRGEALGIKWDSIDFEKDTIDLNTNVIQVGKEVFERSKLKTPKSKRLLSMSNFIKRELIQHKDMCVDLDSPFVCANIFTGDIPSPEYVTKAFHKTLKNEFGIDMRFHDLRHCFNQLGYESNIDEVTRSHMLGHSNTDTTNEIYTHFSTTKNKEAMNTIASLIDPTLNKQ